MRNYGDERILEFERLAYEWENSLVDPHRPRNHFNQAEWWRKEAQRFRDAHETDPYWRHKTEIILDNVFFYKWHRKRALKSIKQCRYLGFGGAVNIYRHALVRLRQHYHTGVDIGQFFK